MYRNLVISVRFHFTFTLNTRSLNATTFYVQNFRAFIFTSTFCYFSTLLDCCFTLSKLVFLDCRFSKLDRRPDRRPRGLRLLRPDRRPDRRPRDLGRRHGTANGFCLSYFQPFEHGSFERHLTPRQPHPDVF